MFFPGSRYENAGTISVKRPDGSVTATTKLPLPTHPTLVGFYPRQQGQRLDLIAARYLKDPTAFWRLCDAGNAMAPDALATHDLIGIPAQGS